MTGRAMNALWRHGIALIGVAAVTALIGLIRSIAPVANVSMLYLVVVLALATRLGRGPAVAASFGAFLAYDWFFVDPIHQLTAAGPSEWLSLGVLLITAIITSQLAANERLRAEQAMRREREAVLLYDALRLIGVPDFDDGLRMAADRIRAELHVTTVGVELLMANGRRTASSGEAVSVPTTTELLGGGRAPTAGAEGGPARWIRMVPPNAATAPVAGNWRRYEVPIQSGTRRIGQISLVREGSRGPFSEHESRLLALLATQLGALVERVELQEAKTRAEVLRRTDELKTSLLNAVSHDLRSPLASIIASAGSLRQTDVQWTDAERAEFVEAIEQQAERLSRIVGNLLDLSRIEAGALRPDKQLHDVGSLIDDVLDRLRPATERHRMSVRVSDDLPPVMLDEVQIDQVLSNLVENAAKYAPAGSEIEVSVHRDDADLIVEVGDHGPGIPPEEIGRLFTPFHRIGGIGTRPPGFGVGLAVAKGLVVAHGGRIWATNRTDGGARFIFTLPLGAVPQAAHAAAGIR
jgi:two-component system sensor histidine kinase KdpD